MEQHLRSANTGKSSEGSEESSIIFREMFCIAAQDLSEQLKQPLESLGPVYEGIINTGKTVKPQITTLQPLSSSAVDVETALKPMANNGKGQMLFVYRQA